MSSRGDDPGHDRAGRRSRRRRLRAERGALRPTPLAQPGTLINGCIGAPRCVTLSGNDIDGGIAAEGIAVHVSGGRTFKMIGGFIELNADDTIYAPSFSDYAFRNAEKLAARVRELLAA